MCYLELIRDSESFKRYPPDCPLNTEQSNQDVDLDPNIIDPDPFTSDDCSNDSSPIHQLPLKKTDESNTMNAGEDEPSSGLNGRLRPRKSTTHNLKIKDARKCDGKYFHEKPKKNITKTKASQNKPDDLHDKSDSSPAFNFLCPYCDKKFASKQTVSKHLRRIHLSTSKQDSFIGCLFCNHAESEPNHIIRHMVDSHPNQYFACFDCHTRVSSTSELAEHKLNVCEKQKPSYRSKLRQKTSSSNKISKKLNFNCKTGFRSNCREYSAESGYNGIVISCELKPTQVHDAADIEDNITTNLILPPNKNIGNSSLLEKNAVIVLDDIQWNKRLPPNFTFHNTDADQILSRLGVIHRTPRAGEGTRRDWFKTTEDSNQKFEKCFDTSFYAQVASNVQENLAKFLDGSFNFNPDADNVIKTRKSKNSVVINTVEGFPILLNCEQYSRNVFDGYLPRTISPKHKCKWDNLENDKILMNPDQLKRDSHRNNCIITLVSSLDIWTQLCMRRKFEDKFCHSPVEKKIEKRNLIDKELKEILESRELPSTSSQVVKYIDKPTPSGVSLEFPISLGLTPSAPQYQIQPAILSGEWVRPRCYVCCACGAQTRDARALTSHISNQHPNAQVQHYEIVGESLLNADILKHLYVPPSQSPSRTRPLRGFRECTKCKLPASLEDLHQHMLDCAGDTPTVRRKCRYRPFGVRRRRPRLPDNTIRKKIRKDMRNRQSQKNYMRSRARPRIKTEVGDAETIRKMLADLPAKRHRVMINPVNSMLRPRRKFDLQRNTLLIKRRPPDDLKNRKLSTKEVSHSRNIGEPNQKKMTNKESNNPMRSKMKHMASKPGNHNESFKRSPVFKRSKRSVRKTDQVDEEKDPTENASSDDPSDGLPLPEGKPPDGSKEQEGSDLPHKIDINGGPYRMRQRSGDHEGSNVGGSGSFPKDGESDSGGGEGNPGGGGHNPNGDRSNNNNGRPSDGRENDDKKPVQNTPLKHSIARLTANSETHDKSVQFHHLFLVQQECNNVTEHAPTGQRELFENEAVVTKLDKPPLHYPKGALDPYALQKSKLNKPRKGLNDCIAMLKNKLVDPPSRAIIDQVSVQCGSDEPIEPVHYTPRTILESGINMTPAEIFYRPVLTQEPMLSNRCNMQNLVSYSYPTTQTIITATRAEKSKARQKRYSQSCDRPISKQKQKHDECLIKRKSSRIKTITQADITVQHELMRLPPQIEIIPQRSDNIHNTKSSKVHCNGPYLNTDPDVILNQQKLNEHVNQKRRSSLDMKIQHKGTKKSLIIIPTESDKTSNIEYQINWSKGQIIKSNSPYQNQETKQTQVIITDSKILKPSKDTSTCDVVITSDDNYSETNYNDVSSTIPVAYSSEAVDSDLSSPLDLSGKAISGNRLEKSLQGDDIYYNTNYDSYETLDLSNKRSDYLTVTKEDSVTDIVVDLSIRPVEQPIPKPTNNNIYLNSTIDQQDILTDLSISTQEIDNFPEDLSMKVNEINLRQENLENLTYEVQDLSTSKSSNFDENGMLYSSDFNDIDKDIPTDLSGKSNKEFSDLSHFPSMSDENDDEFIESLDLTKKIELPADLSTKSNNEKQTILPPILDVSNKLMGSTQDTNINSSSSPIADQSQSVKTTYGTYIKQYEIKDNTTTPEETVIVDVLESSDTELPSLKPAYTASQPDTVHTYDPNVYDSDIVMPQIRTSTEFNISSQETAPCGYAQSPVNVTSNAIKSCISLYTLPNSIQSNRISKYDTTKPVYTLANACISITKLETANETTLTNTLLSVPGTTIANTTSVYTLAGTSVDTPMRYGKISHSVNEIRHIIDNNNTCHSSISPSHDNSMNVDQYNLSLEDGSEFEKGTKDAYSTIVADLDPDAASKIAKLPKEIVEILGTMPVDHRKQLLNILPHYVTTSTSDSCLQDKSGSADPHELPLTNVVTSKKSPYLQVQTADSTSGSKNFNNMKMEDDCCHTNLHKCHSPNSADIKLIPLPPSPLPLLNSEAIQNDSLEIVHNEQMNVYDTTTKENDCSDIKIIDLTQDDNIDVQANTIKEIDGANRTVVVTGSEIKASIISKGIKHKINDQTASLRAVRIKTPSERLKVVSKDNQVLLKKQIAVSKQNTSVEDNKVDNKPLTITTAGVNIKVTGETNSTVISQVDFESNNKQLKDDSNKKSSEYITIKIDVDQDSKNEHVNNSSLNSTTSTSNDIIHSNKAHKSPDTANEHIDDNASQVEVNGVNSKKNKSNNITNTTENVDHDVSIIMSTTKKDMINENNQNTWLKPSIDNGKDISDEDDSEDDILLAVIVKQKREKQNVNKIEKESKYNDVHDNTKKVVAAPTTCNDETCQTKEQNVPISTPLRTSCRSNEKDHNESQVLERAESVSINTINLNENMLKSLDNEQKNVQQIASKPIDNIESTINQIEKVDMGVQYECISKEPYNECGNMLVGTDKDTCNVKHADEQVVDETTNQTQTCNAIDANNSHKANISQVHSSQDVSKKTINGKDTCSQNGKSMVQYGNDNLRNVDETTSRIITNEQIKINNALDEPITTLCSSQILEECVIMDDKSPSKNSITVACPKESMCVNDEKTSFPIQSSINSDIEEKAQIPLRRSRRGKSMFVNRNDTIAYDDGNVTHTDIMLEQKTPLTKKQLIFSKLLLDGENISDIPAHSTPEKDINIQKECVNNHGNDISDIIPQNLSSVDSSASEIDVNKSKKRTKSSQARRKIKKNKSLENMEISDTDECLQFTKVLKTGNNYATDTVASENIITAQTEVQSVFKEGKCDQQIDSSINKSDSTLKIVGGTSITITECSIKLPVSDLCNINNHCEQISASAEKRKLILPTTSSDLALDSKPKRSKTKIRNETATSTFFQHDNSKEEARFDHKNQSLLNVEPRTTCYNRPVALKRTRSKSATVKTTEKELTYDPYDIDLDDMIAKAEPIVRKRHKSERITSSNRVHKVMELPSTSSCKEIKKRDASPIIRRKVKKSIKHRDRLRREKRIKDTSDSDESSKSDVPLTKYIKDRDKRTKESYDGLPDRDDYEMNLSDGTSSGKQIDPDCGNKKRPLISCNNADTFSSHDETEERLKSEQFMESFGFFSERKPRKSNLIAAKKISETFHIIANESDDAYVGYRERAIKRALQNENRKAREGESSRAQGTSGARKATRRGGRKRKSFTRLLRYSCKICKKEFRRPDNYLRHQLTLIHIARLAEQLNIKISPFLEEPNYLIVYKQHIDRLKIITDKLAKKKKTSKSASKITLPTITEILLEVNRVVREQLFNERGLSRDEALFLDCCELLKESHINDGDPHNIMNSNYRCPQATMTGLALIEKQIDEDKSDDCKSDGEVDSMTAKNILESEEVRNLENDLISGLKEAANANNTNNMNCLSYRNADDNARMDPNDTVVETFPNPSHFGETADKFDNTKEPTTNKVKKTEVKRMMYPDIIEDIDMYEDKFDKIKRKCRSQAAAAKQIQNVVETNTSLKTRKKTDKKKIKKKSKKKYQSTQVPTKGALKGFDSVKVSNSQSEPNKSLNLHEHSKKKKRKSGSKKKKDKKDSESSNKNEIDNHTKDTTAAHKKVDVYEFMDNEDAELFEFRPSTLMERFKSINNKAIPGTSKITPLKDNVDNSSDTVSDGDDFVYISDDYVGSADETENSMSCEVSNTKVTNELKKTVSPLKRKDTVEKNAVMGKIFKNNAVRTEKKFIKHKEISKPKANMDQLFDSLLEEGPRPSEDPQVSEIPEHCPRYVTTTAFEETSLSSPNYVLSPTKSPKDYVLKSPDPCDSSSKKCNEYIDYTPSTSKKMDEIFKVDYNSESRKYITKLKNYKELSPKRDFDTTESNKQGTTKLISQPLSKYPEISPNSDYSPTNLNLKENYKDKSPSKKTDEGIGTSYDYSAELFDQVSYDDTGVARQRARRKCTVGKQKVLAETWSSESEPDGLPPRPNSAASMKSDSCRKKRGRKKEGHHSSGRRGINRTVTFKKHDESKVTSTNRNELCDDGGRSDDGEISRTVENIDISRSAIKWLKDYRTRDEQPSGSHVAPHKSFTPVAVAGTSGTTSKIRPRPSSYYWSSDGDDEQGHPQQHGWIVGDSHKKLVTMLAHAKGRKRNNDDKRHLLE